MNARSWASDATTALVPGFVPGLARLPWGPQVRTASWVLLAGHQAHPFALALANSSLPTSRRGPGYLHAVVVSQRSATRRRRAARVGNWPGCAPRWRRCVRPARRSFFPSRKLHSGSAGVKRPSAGKQSAAHWRANAADARSLIPCSAFAGGERRRGAGRGPERRAGYGPRVSRSCCNTSSRISSGPWPGSVVRPRL